MLTEGRKKNICLFHGIMKVQNVKLLYSIPIMEILKIYLDNLIVQNCLCMIILWIYQTFYYTSAIEI